MLCWDDPYKHEFDAVVTSYDSGWVELDRTYFYPQGGGVDGDSGVLKWDTDIQVLDTQKVNGKILHKVDSQVSEGAKVHAIIDWSKRYALMKMHTAAHVLSAVFHKHGALIGGGSISLPKSKIDFTLPEMDKSRMRELFDEAVSIMQEGHEVTSYFLPRDEALKMPGMVKLASKLPPAVKTLRIVKIGDIDTQADGGLHVKNTKEIDNLKLLKIDNKGKGHRRLYFSVI